MGGPQPHVDLVATPTRPGDVDAIQRRRVFDAVLAELERGGPAVLTRSRVLDRAGMSARTFHAHFASLDDCLLAAYATCAGELEGRLRAAWDAAGAWPEKVRAAIAAALDFAARNRAAVRFLALDAAALGDQLAASQAASLDRLAAELRRGRRLRPLPAGLHPLTERVLVAGAVAVVAERLGAPGAEALAGLERELCELVLAPYVGVGWGAPEGHSDSRPPAEFRTPADARP